ncbi:MAG: cation-transporting P-type ATPase [Deltaproteobacteria bacterium]|nr:cation-transporting P-type ATPase [Deltaproteobacteria bacterium]
MSGRPREEAGDGSAAVARPAAGAPVAVHAEPVRELLGRLGASPAQGLSAAEVARRRREHGPNRLPEPPRVPGWRRLLAQLRDPLVLTLLGAAAVAVLVGMSERPAASLLERFGDAIAILLIVVMNALIGFFQERRAEAALEALQKLSAPSARVRREGRVQEVPAAEVVPGDIVELEAGDAVPADARLLHTLDLATEESALTGESMPVGKDAAAPVAADAPIADQTTMVFTATMVVRGKARAVVTATGARTELGSIGELMRSVRDEKTPLELRLQKFSKMILWICLGLSAALMAWGLVRGGRAWHELLLEAVSLAVAAIPEGLPAVTTITLALGMQRMARRGAIVRRLPAVETLGAATVICSDKTGTLTQNEMTVREIYAAGHRYRVTGEGYDLGGDILTEDGQSVLAAPLSETLQQALSVAALCNNAELERNEATGRWRVVGDPTEGALLTVAAKGGCERMSVSGSHIVLRELPFDSDRQRMSVVTRDAQGREVAHVKGSVDVLLPRCQTHRTDDGLRKLGAAEREAILGEAERMSGQALRVLCLCRHEQLDHAHIDEAEHVERELTFLGLVGMMDPPRPGVKQAVATCAHAGIRAVMITGDHKLTATAVAREIGLWQEGDLAITGTELGAMSDAELDARIGQARIFARTSPEQKLRIVRALKRRGEVVAMTGDGVNDAPALREAHIGVAMGRGGTDVARQASDLVLADDNFATIVEAVREGRAIFRNIQKFIFFLLSANMGLVTAVFAVSFFGAWPPLTPLMILWINLVTNGLPALALGVDPPDRKLMDEPPRAAEDGLLGRRDLLGIAYVGVVMGGAAVALYALSPQDGPALGRARALAFTLLALSPLMHSLSCRSPRRSILSLRPVLSAPLMAAVAASTAIHLVAVLVPTLQPVFKTFPVTLAQWALVLALAALVIPAVELAKGVARVRRRGAAAPGAAAPARLSSSG